jgi:hypothetical protein
MTSMVKTKTPHHQKNALHIPVIQTKSFGPNMVAWLGNKRASHNAFGAASTIG